MDSMRGGPRSLRGTWTKSKSNGNHVAGFNIASGKFVARKSNEEILATAGQIEVDETLLTIPTTMQAAVYRGVDDVRLETVPVPEIGPGELLVRVHTCGICGTDLKKIATGSHSAPRIFGHETSGTVAAVGTGVDAVPARRPGRWFSTIFHAANVSTASIKLLRSARRTRK